jgi:ATP-dependent Lon protease
VGTVAVIMRMLKLPDDRIRVLVQGVSRARMDGLVSRSPFTTARITTLNDGAVGDRTLEAEALMGSVKRALERASSLGKNVPSEVQVIANNLEDGGRLADLTSSNLELEIEDAQAVLERIDPVERLKLVGELLKKEIDLLAMQREIDSLARDEIDKSQREYYLRQQMKAIRHELGEGSELEEEIDEIRAKVQELELPEPVAEEIERQIKRLERMPPDSAESGTVRNYLEWLVELPWTVETKDALDLVEAQRILDEDHYALDQPKERIVEHLAVRKLKPDIKGPILCFVGPPGTGKTSLGRSIARAMDRKFVRVSLGGVRDEAEIRGHRRTYVGSMPGRIVQAIRQAGSRNPVMMLDEVDKLGNDFRGDPQAALLEVLDPEQNHTFRDHYLGVPFDLSRVLFITTANLIDPIHPAFRDRMEVIRLPGYTEEEKLEIARRHLIPKQISENGLDTRRILLSEGAVRELIHRYTREAGLRNLERSIASVCRKVARSVAEGRERSTRVIASSLETFLGPPPASSEEKLVGDALGVATGLAWTQSGGEVLFVEAITMPGRGDLILTGHLGSVMQESARAALSYVRARAALYGIREDVFSGTDVHLHVPEGAIPKDGPSAGVTLITSLLSSLTGRPVRRRVAMTGEITLRGNVLPVGGVKEKVLAARRSGASVVVLPEQNQKELKEVPRAVRRDLEFVAVRHVDEVFEVAFSRPQAAARAAGGRKRRTRAYADAG